LGEGFDQRGADRKQIRAGFAVPTLRQVEATGDLGMPFWQSPGKASVALGRGLDPTEEMKKCVWVKKAQEVVRELPAER